MDTSQKKLTPKTRKLVKKLIALLSSPSKGEAAAAREKLERLKKKYKIDEHLLEQINESKQFYTFSYKNQWEKKLLTDIVCWVMNDIHPRAKDGKRGQLMLFISPTQYRNILGAFNHCRDQFNDICEVVTTVIISKGGMMVNQDNPSNIDEDPEPTDIIFNGDPEESSGSAEPPVEETPPVPPPQSKSEAEAFAKQMKTQALMYRLFNAIEVTPYKRPEPIPLGLPSEQD